MNEIQQEELNRQLFDALMQGGNAEQFQKLTEDGANILEAANENGITILHLFAVSGQEEMVELLIKSEADVNKEDDKGRTALYYAAFYGQERMVELLIRNGADVNKEDNEGMTPLYCTAFYGQKEMVKLLIRNGANVNRRYGKGYALLQGVAINGQEEMVRTFIENGADVNAESSLGISLDISIRKGHTGITELVVNRIVELEDANLHVSERNLQLKTQVMPEIKKEYSCITISR